MAYARVMSLASHPIAKFENQVHKRILAKDSQKYVWTDATGILVGHWTDISGIVFGLVLP